MVHRGVILILLLVSVPALGRAADEAFLAGLSAEERAFLEAHPLIGEFRGVGLIGALEVVKDKATREIHPAEANVMGILGASAKEHGLILRLIGNRIAFSPPQIITESEIGEMVKRLKLALDDTWGAIAPH